MSLWVCACVCQSNTRGTVKDKANFKVEEDVAALRKAIEGLGKLISYHFQHLFSRYVTVSEKHVKHFNHILLSVPLRQWVEQMSFFI